MRANNSTQHRYFAGLMTRQLCAILLAALSVSSTYAQVFSPGSRYGTSTVRAVVTADFDGDNDIDIAVNDRYVDTIYVHLNDGAGNFSDIRKFEAARDGGLAAADFNNDGYADLVTYDGGYLSDEWGTTVYMNNGDATFTITMQDTIGTSAFATADFNGDDYDDIAVYHYVYQPQYGDPGIWIFYSNGDGSFADPVLVDPTAIDGPLAGDVDNDGDIDLLFNISGDAVCRLNDGSGTFSEPVSTATGGMLGVLTELNGDEFPDLLRRQTYACSGHAVCFIGSGDGTFAPPHPAWITAGLLSGIALTAADFTSDGYPDIALYAPENAYVDVGLNDGRLDFERFHETVPTVTGGLYLAAADFDNDGDPDLAAIGDDDTLTIAFSLGAQHIRTHMVPDDYPTIQEAVDAAWNLDTILVCAGTYIGPIDFGGKNLVLTSIDCSGAARGTSTSDALSRAQETILDGGGAARVLTFDNFEDDRSVVSGFTIQNGNAPNYGGGIYCYDTASPTITNNIIINNHAVSAGGGIFNNKGAATIRNNIIASNSSGNWGGGIYAGAASIMFNTIYGNTAGAGGGGLYYNYGDPAISCNIIWGNSSTTGGQQVDYLTTEPAINYSVVQGGWPGVGNIDSDPMFVDPLNFDFNLMPGSPCINAGDPGMPLDPDGSVADIGAYYFPNPSDADDNSEGSLPGEFCLNQNYPNPFNPTTIIDYILPRSGHVTIDVYNLLGQKVITLVDGEQTAGIHHAIWDGLDAAGDPAASGIYLYRLRAENYVETKKMLLMK